MTNHYEWDAGEKAAKARRIGLIFAFVDLKHKDCATKAYAPDVYFVASEDLVDWFVTRQQQRNARGAGDIVRYRFHPDYLYMESKRNNWHLIEDRLGPSIQHAPIEG
jgi:hypothetical protein